MINPKNKRIEATLTEEDYELLLNLCIRFNSTKSEVISKALKIMASKNKHDLHIMYRESFNPKYITNTEEEELKKIVNSAPKKG